MKTKILLSLILLSISLLNFTQSSQLIYSTFIGGKGEDRSLGIVLDTAGNVYVAGQTNSNDFPTTPGAFDWTRKGSEDVFITKLNSSGTALVYSTYLGGVDYDAFGGLAVDSAGSAYVTGFTESTDFPITSGSLYTSSNGEYDAFVTKINPAGTDLVYSTYLGGGNSDYGEAITIDAVGNAYVTGETYSTDFPTTPGAFDTSKNNVYSDAFVSKLNSRGTGLIYSTFLGGGNKDFGDRIAVDTAGNAFITGGTLSADFPTTIGAFDTSFNGNWDVVVTKLNSRGTGLIYSTFLGSTNYEYGQGIVVDTAGNAYIMGQTNSADFPTTPGAFDTSFNGTWDVVVTKLNSGGTGLIYSTFLGGGDNNYGHWITIDTAGNAYIVGGTLSTNFPTTIGAYDTTKHGYDYDVILTKLNSTGSGLLYSTYIGGVYYDEGNGIAVDKAGNAYITGLTGSSEFPTTPLAYDTSYIGAYDVFVVKMAPFPAPVINSIPSLKLFMKQSLNPAFDLKDYNIAGTATTYNPVSNFLNLSGLTGSIVYQSKYSSPTSGSNTYELVNPYGSSTASNKVKYSTYKIKRLPQVVLRPNQSRDMNVGSFTIDSNNNLAIPPSYNQSDSLMVSDANQLSAMWSNSSIVTITALSGFTSMQEVDVIASPQATGPYGVDIDKERIEVYPALSTTAFEFNNSSDTSLFSYQLPSGISSLATIEYTTTISDIHGGALQMNFSTPSSGVKITPNFNTWLPNTPQTWYTLRVRVFGTNTANSYLQFFFNGDYGKTPLDIQGYYKFSVPSTWTYIDIPMDSFASVSTATVMYPQLVLKANGGTGIIYIDEIEIFQATPPLVTSRYKTFDNYIGGSWKDSSATTQWAKEVLSGSGSINVSNGQLYVTTSGSSSSPSYLKFTASTAKNTIYTIPSNVGYQAGMHMNTALISGTTNLSQTMVQVNLLGANTKGAFITSGDIASAVEIGRVSNRTLQLAFNANSPFYQVQFIVKNTGNSSFQIDNTLADIDNGDPNYGDANLYP